MSPVVDTWLNLRWAFSPCPNDTFTFGALVLGLLPEYPQIPTPQHLDIDQLNALAAVGGADVVKVSTAAYRYVAADYQVLESGAALGFGVGPLLVSRAGWEMGKASQCRVAIPGERTTANALLSHFYPALQQKEVYVFSEIEQAVNSGAADLGLLIHEGRFTYQSKGLACVADLGALWEEEYGIPIPLGVICARRSLDEAVKVRVAHAIQASVQYAWVHSERIWDYVLAHAAEMDRDVVRQHIELYVTRFSESLGAEGRAAVLRLGGLGGEGVFVGL